MTELKPCPFCGNEPVLDRHDIFCDYCGVKLEIPIYVEGKESIGGLPTYKEAKQEMIETWNSRIYPEEVIKEIVERYKI